MSFFLMQKMQISLNDLFDIRQGLLVKDKEGSAAFKYKTIFISDIPDNPYDSIDLTQVKEYSSSKPFPTKHLLNQEDYLLSCKGQIRGYALKHCLKENVELIASNHFLVLTPRTFAKQTFASDNFFLYHLLDLLIPKLRDHANTKIRKGPVPYITKSELSTIQLNIPIIQLNHIINEFSNLFNNYLTFKKKLDSYDNELIKSIDIKFPVNL